MFANPFHYVINCLKFTSQVQFNLTFDYIPSPFPGLFNVDPMSGDVYVDASLQGRMGLYSLVLTVTDQGDQGISAGALRSETVVYVTVEDVNDNRPQITSPAINATHYIYEVRCVGNLYYHNNHLLEYTIVCVVF